MAERSRARGNGRPEREFSRIRLFIGVLLLALVGAGIAFGLGRLRGAPPLGRVVYAGDNGVFVRDLAKGSARRVAVLPDGTLSAIPSPDGRWLAYTLRRGDLWLINLTSGDNYQVSERLTAALGWMPDGRLVAHELLAQRDMVAIDPEGRHSARLFTGFPGGRVVWIDDKRFLWSGSGDLTLVRIGEKPPTKVLLAKADVLERSPDGKEVLFVKDPDGKAPQVEVASLSGDKIGKGRVVFRGLATEAAVSPQGFVAFAGRDRSKHKATWVLEGGTQPPRRIVARAADELAWSQNGGSLLYLVGGVLYAQDLRNHHTIRLSPRGTRVLDFGVVR